jgi:hypothetical protein
VKLIDISGTKRRTLKANIAEHETDSKNNNIRDCTGASVTLRRVTGLEVIQLRMGRVIWLQTANIILARWRNHFSQLLNVHGVNDVRLKYKQQSHSSLTP